MENKYLYPTFFNYIKSFEIFILLETHLEDERSERARMFFNGFHLIFIPATRNHRHGRAIGGKIYGISKKLEDFGITYEVNESSDAQLLIIRTTTYVFTLIPTYIRPDSWSEEFNSLKDVYNNLEITNGIIMGDLNVRIGELKQYLNEIGTEMFVAGYDVRKSKDKVINKKGKQFVEFCNDSNLFILNGITLGDGEGNVTYANTLGQSVNDICSASLELLGFVNNFSVDDKIWSDHFPIVLKLNYNISAESGQKMNLLPKLIWKDKMKYKYQRRLNEIMDNYEVATSNLKLSNLCEMITKSWPQKPNEMQSFQPKHKWYNFSCNEARLKSFKLLAKYRKSNNLEDKILYLKAQNSYKSICTNSKNMYYQNISAKINIINNAKEWWKMAREMRNHQNKISSHISPLLFKQHFENLLNTSQIMSQIHYAPPLNHDPILDGPITMGELENMLHKVKLNKAPGEDRIPYEFFVYATEQFHLQLLSTYNNIFNESTMDKIFTKSIIYPIHKKGDYDNPSNYRGISFMNCAAKIFMGILNDRIYTWAEENHILVEYQAGFRRQYSTVDNIYNLAAIVSLKLSERKKVYAFFIDFKAAFDNISRQALIFKLHQIGLSYKIVKVIENIYKNTESAVWTGQERSEYFATTRGVKQGCLLSPMLFTLYINDLHDNLGGGLYIENINIRLLLYADDIVLLADDITIMQEMIGKLETYCKTWNLEVNLEKSDIMVFRNGGRPSKKEVWKFNERQVRITNEFKYLGVTFTPTMKFGKHVQNRNIMAKNALNTTWDSVIGRNDICMNAKWRLYLSVCRSIQTYAAQVWGFAHFEEVNFLQRFFIKKLLRLPMHTPTYILMLETDVEDSQIYSLGLHLKYLGRIMFQYNSYRLPNQLTAIVMRKNIFWVKELRAVTQSLNVQWPETINSIESWNTFSTELLCSLKLDLKHKRIQRKLQSDSRDYKFLNPSRAQLYLNDKYTQEKIAWIFKARSGMLYLGYNRFTTSEEERLCKLCNMRAEETFQHFLGICPILSEFRMMAFGKTILNQEEILEKLDGKNDADWDNIVTYLKSAYTYRHYLLSEFQ